MDFVVNRWGCIMQYRSFGVQGFDTSIIGLGTMRLPLLADGTAKDIDEERAIRLIRKAVDMGVNYIDTAFPYHGGMSEVVVGKALRSGYRDRVTLVDKCPVWLVESYEDFEKYLDMQLERLQTDHLDVYLLHALNLESWKRIEALGALDFLETQKAKGKIRAAGFSFHDSKANFNEIIQAHRWDMTLIQMNYMDEFEQATLEGLALAGELGIPVVIMEPLKGGLLATAPEDIAEIMEECRPDWTPVEWSFRWLAHRPEVKVILSGMSSEEQLFENVHIGDRLQPLNFKEEDFNTIERIRNIYNSRIQVACTQCGYCMPCPSGVKIPDIFECYNLAHVYENKENVMKLYRQMVKAEQSPTRCTACGACKTACPQQIDIPKVLEQAADYFE